eukprot:875118-Heterocapsa_arctica.AAC.1
MRAHYYGFKKHCENSEALLKAEHAETIAKLNKAHAETIATMNKDRDYYLYKLVGACALVVSLEHTVAEQQKTILKLQEN